MGIRADRCFERPVTRSFPASRSGRYDVLVIGAGGANDKDVVLYRLVLSHYKILQSVQTPIEQRRT